MAMAICEPEITAVYVACNTVACQNACRVAFNLISGKDVITEMESAKIQLFNGSRLIFTNVNPCKLVGVSAKYVFIDDIDACISDDPEKFKSFYATSIAVPMTMQNQSQIVISTANLKIVESKWVWSGLFKLPKRYYIIKDNSGNTLFKLPRSNYKLLNYFKTGWLSKLFN